MRLVGFGALLCALFASVAIASADEPPHFTYAPAPPGTIEQSEVVYLAGEAMHSQWRAVLSRLHTKWYLSLYAIDGTTYRLTYRSEASSFPVPPGEPFVTSASIAGVGEFMGPGVQQVVVVSRAASSATCGRAQVDVIFEDAAMQKPMATLTVRTSCVIAARVVHGPAGDVLIVTGQRGSATFHFSNGKWAQTPRVFPNVSGG